MENKRELISVKQAAEILNRSPAAIYKAVHDGRLHYADTMRRLLDRKNIEQHFARSTRPRADKPMAAPPAPEPESAPEDRAQAFQEAWAAIAESANATLDHEAWSGPPWSGEQWAVLAGCIEIGIQDLRADSPCTPEKGR